MAMTKASILPKKLNADKMALSVFLIVKFRNLPNGTQGAPSELKSLHCV